MDTDHSQPNRKPSSLRWQILRRALIRRPSSDPVKDVKIVSISMILKSVIDMTLTTRDLS
ncbi:UNVERIFIED_CONTAM: hypothetical protein Sindi_2588500, partial [Sesamum indicum]